MRGKHVSSEMVSKAPMTTAVPVVPILSKSFFLSEFFRDMLTERMDHEDSHVVRPRLRRRPSNHLRGLRFCWVGAQMACQSNLCEKVLDSAAMGCWQHQWRL